MKYIDISLPINSKTAMYPNNPPFSTREIKTKTSFLSEISLGSHIGTHVDAPRHVFKNGVGVDALALKHFIGPCRVLDMTHCTHSISLLDLKREKIKKGERILVKTKNSLRGFKKIYPTHIFLGSDAATYLASKKILLFCIDSLSIKERGSMDNRPHTELLKRGIPIVEGVNLSRVKPGRYDFIGVPLALTGLDGSPIRAILVKR